MEKIRTMFIGTSEFAVPSLQYLMEADYIDLVCVVSQPDRPVGRKQILQSPAVITFLKEIRNSKFEVPNIEQPERIRDVGEELMEKYQPELIIVASYGQIIPNSILDYPKYKALNIHASLLPHLRGAVPIPMAILEGLERTGVTLQVMAERLDEGDIIQDSKLKIQNDETTETLENKLKHLAVDLLEEALPKWIAGEIEARAQDHSLATFCGREDIAKDKAEITFETNVEMAERMVRAFYPWPVAWFRLTDGDHEGKRVKVFRSKKRKSKVLSAARHGEDPKKENGSMGNDQFSITKEDGRLFLHVHDGVLELLEIQLEGKQRREAGEYLYLI